MSIVAAHCCCAPGPTPAPDCPEGTTPPTPPTVTISLTATPIACTPVKSVLCVPADCGCDDGTGQTYIIPSAICNFDCAPQIPAYIPRPTFASGLGSAQAIYAWSTYTDEPAVNCPGALFNFAMPCGSIAIDYTPWEIVSEFPLGCGTAGAESVCIPCTSAIDSVTYHPSQESYDNGHGVRIQTFGCCCVTCACNPNPKCSTITVSIHARWKLTLEVPNVVSVANDPGGCWCGEFPVFTGGSWWHRQPPFYSNTIDFTHEQTLDMVFEQTIYTTQTETRLAPGNYLARCVSMTNQCGAVYMCGAFWDNDGCLTGGGFVDAGLDCDVPCLVQNEECNDALLTAHGWSINVSVGA
jgi:hypothetical protein